MKNVVKMVFGLILAAGIGLTAKAQTPDSLSAPAEDAIVCRQVAENIFDCYVDEGNTNQELFNDNKGMEEDYSKAPDDKNYNQHEYNSNPDKGTIDRENRELQENKNNPYNKEEDIDWNRSEKSDSLNRARDVYHEQQKMKPSQRGNEDNVHMNGDQTEYDKMYEYDRSKKKEGDPDNTDPMFGVDRVEIQAFRY